ncbi:hypothetical protein TTHERM_000354669 (macronuclear) [Tetrahymena thermophila SB210]|uniref:Uncharacterized protein n=1 Tax=Tetrahymena thermophila (strain SB210) TaxID=312017 RepID=W7XCR4_TETTS|nr:hypothetical protein TTHERM_000354669 [Tetrahymena thermophila SB210]EWS75272.1 hypothetical protein TTHERM_000354669 [Tetrahymena thermophila SB210]|eukprot:XP_012652263.1 hypothetical protein TTHERM_000354669 [Tetrahymena thermophila SB210]
MENQIQTHKTNKHILVSQIPQKSLNSTTFFCFSIMKRIALLLQIKMLQILIN